MQTLVHTYQHLLELGQINAIGLLIACSAGDTVPSLLLHKLRLTDNLLLW